MALHEDAVIDPHYGCCVNHDLAGYHVKGVGELGICGAGAALANAVYNAFGVRLRGFPLTLDKVLVGLEQARLGLSAPWAVTLARCA